MKTLVVFYSRSGNTKKIADEIVNILGCDAEEVSVSGIRKGPLGFLNCLQEAIRKKRVKIRRPEKDPSAYDLVIIGSPVWGGRLSSPVRTYIESNKESFKRVAVFCAMGGENEYLPTDIEDTLGSKPEAFLGVTSKELLEPSWKGKVEEFTKKLK